MFYVCILGTVSSPSPCVSTSLLTSCVCVSYFSPVPSYPAVALLARTCMPDGSIPMVFLYGELASGKRARGRAHLSLQGRLQKRDEDDGHRHREVGRHCQRSLTLETRFTPTTWAGGETKACHRREPCSMEEEKKKR